MGLASRWEEDDELVLRILGHVCLGAGQEVGHQVLLGDHAAELLHLS